jgi:hypothetical protein
MKTVETMVCGAKAASTFLLLCILAAPVRAQTLPACGPKLAPTCNGLCPAGELCVLDGDPESGGKCVCRPPNAPACTCNYETGSGDLNRALITALGGGTEALSAIEVDGTSGSRVLRRIARGFDEIAKLVTHLEPLLVRSTVPGADFRALRDQAGKVATKAAATASELDGLIQHARDSGATTTALATSLGAARLSVSNDLLGIMGCIPRPPLHPCGPAPMPCPCSVPVPCPFPWQSCVGKNHVCVCQ